MPSDHCIDGGDDCLSSQREHQSGARASSGSEASDKPLSPDMPKRKREYEWEVIRLMLASKR